MRIESLHFKNITEGWELSETKFDDLNLLVGVSGAGKTQILEAIRTVCRCGTEPIPQALEWKFSFLIGEERCEWEAVTQRSTKSEFPYSFLKEVIRVGDSVVIKTDDSGTSVKAQPPIKINTSTSAIKSLDYEELRLIRQELKKLTLVVADSARLLFYAQKIKNQDDRFSGKPSNGNWARFLMPGFLNTPKRIAAGFGSLEELQQALYEPAWKIFFAQEAQKQIFEEIKADFISAFPQVEDLEAHAVSLDSGDYSPLLLFKLQGQDAWIAESRIASGMLKTLFFIALVRLSANGTVLLIDEFENSLGINCLDVVTDQLFGSRELQFIITSHHPYVINNIPMEYWKVVTRKGGVIQTHSAEELKLGRSKHKAFTELINSKEFRQGVAA